MLNLSPHRSNPALEAKITVDHRMSGKYFCVGFSVACSELFENEKFSMEHCHNIGLWDFDVTEVFIQRGTNHTKYLELQISPLGQVFALYIDEPRIKTRSINEFSELKTSFSAIKTLNGFNTEFKVAVSDIPGAGDKLFGNFFACLGPKDFRSYFALNTNSEEIADFHRPELFQPLGTIL